MVEDPIEKLKALATTIAEAHEVSTTTVFNILDSEHWGKEWDVKAESPTGDFGLCQVNIESWGWTKDDALDPVKCLNFLAEQIKKGNEYYWTSCSCVKQVRAFGVKFPKISSPSELTPNTSPAAGVIALFNYSGTPHMALIYKIESNGFWVKEANMEKCKRSERFISWGDKSILGFWKSEP